MSDRLNVTRSAVGERLRHIREHHPEGAMTRAELAERSGVSLRTIAALESAEGANVQVDTLIKLTHSLGIRRVAYLLDADVFAQVNRELALSVQLREARVAGVEAVLLRNSTGISDDAASTLNNLLDAIVGAARQAKGKLQGDASDTGR
ncbi:MULTISPECIES: helix-turn-helix domain-containing protein [unclassified Kutzneria]|uniref:helix-turn-helix domain-containing protein n=1 Tax=unclassified Kutzneria TaxID=2621979 RepID=UPI0018DBD184|nr:helix-turn-helix transcriptional regulator [Kutzneria sp. 744]